MTKGFLRLGQVLLFCSVLRIAVSAQSQPNRIAFPSPKAKLWAAVYVSKALLRLSEVDKLPVYFVVVNDGPTTVDPHLEASRLLINGKEARWSVQINNIPTNPLKSLRPGNIAELSSPLGHSYLGKPGVYTLKWKGPAFVSPEMTFRVLDH